MKIVIHIILLLFFMGSRTQLLAQTCCSGGVPLSGNVGFSPSNKGAFQIQIDYDDNVLKTLKSGSDKLDDDARIRHTRSIIYQVGYGITDKLSIDLFHSFIGQERKIQQSGNTDILRTTGFGDLALLLKYKWLSFGEIEHTSITSALGTKFPIGSTTKKSDLGLTINADLQPGSGSFDGIFWTQFIHQLNARPSLNISSTIIYNLKGKNKDYLDAFEYKFGNEFQFHIGVSDRILIGKMMNDPSIQFRYRRASRDQQEKIEIESTGGDWLFLHLDHRLWFNQKIAFHAGIDVPLYGRVNGTQLSPSYRLNAGFYFLFTKENKDLNNFNL